jgi:hypothetical protein
MHLAVYLDAAMQQRRLPAKNFHIVSFSKRNKLHNAAIAASGKGLRRLWLEVSAISS